MKNSTMSIMSRGRTKGSQQSISYHYSESLIGRFFNKEHLYPKTYVGMFIDDVKASVLPLRRNKEKWVKLSTADNAIGELVLSALDESAHELQDAMWHFADKGLIYNLLQHQKVYFEIVYFPDGSFRFVEIWPHTMWSFFGNVIQYVPKNIRTAYKYPKFIGIKSDYIFVVRLPKHLKRNLRQVMRGLGYVSDNIIMPEFKNKEFLKEGSWPAFNSGAYRKGVELYLAKITKKIGWNARQTFQNDQLEYYQLTRFLRFEGFKLEVRQCIIKGLNQGFRKVKKDWQTPEVIWNVFPDEKDIQNSVSNLSNGNIKFNDIYKAYLRY